MSSNAVKCGVRASDGILGDIAKPPGLAAKIPGALSSFLGVQSVAFGTGEGLLRYGIRIRCSKRLPPVRDASSEALGAQNRLLRYGRNIRYRKPPSLVRNEAAIAWLALIRGCGRMRAPVRGCSRMRVPVRRCDCCRSGSGGGCYGLARIAKLCLIPVSRLTIAE